MFTIRTIFRQNCHRIIYNVPIRKATSFRKKILLAFQRHLGLVNGVTSGIFMALGDLIQQEIEVRYQNIGNRYNWIRAGQMFTAGLLIGPLHHIYYLKLDRLLPGATLKIVLIKIAADQFVASPLTILAFFVIMGVLESKNFEKIVEEIQRKAIYVYLGDWCFWPPVQFINFYFLPWQYRVVYINIVTMIFNVFLSYIKHDFDAGHNTKDKTKDSQNTIDSEYTKDSKPSEPTKKRESTEESGFESAN